MHNVVALRQPGPARHKGLKVLLSLGLAAWGMLFASLLLSLAFIRVQAEVWPPAGAAPADLLQGALAGGLLLGGALAVALGARAQRGGRATVAGPLLVLGTALVLASVSAEVQLFGEARRQAGASRDALGSAYRSFLLLHAVQVGTALPGLCWVTGRAFRTGPAQALRGGAWALGVYLGFSCLAFAGMFLLVHWGG